MMPVQSELPIPGLYPLRERVLEAVRDGDGVTVAELADALGARRPAVRHHLLRLVEAGEAHQRNVPVPGRGRVALYRSIPTAPPTPPSGVRLRVIDDGPGPRFPRSRSECPEEGIPCPWFRCEHHLGLSVTHTGRLHEVAQYMPDDEDDGQWNPPEPCSLRRALAGRSSRDQVAEAMGCTEARVGQIELEALDTLERRNPGLRSLLED
jgi:hypothetical protein